MGRKQEIKNRNDKSSVSSYLRFSKIHSKTKFGRDKNANAYQNQMRTSYPQYRYKIATSIRNSLELSNWFIFAEN